MNKVKSTLGDLLAVEYAKDFARPRYDFPGDAKCDVCHPWLGDCTSCKGTGLHPIPLTEFE